MRWIPDAQNAMMETLARAAKRCVTAQASGMPSFRYAVKPRHEHIGHRSNSYRNIETNTGQKSPGMNVVSMLNDKFQSSIIATLAL